MRLTGRWRVLGWVLLAVSVGVVIYAALSPSMSFGVQVQNESGQDLTVVVFDSHAKRAAAYPLPPGESRRIPLWSGEGKKELTGRAFGLIALNGNAKVCFQQTLAGESLSEQGPIVINPLEGEQAVGSRQQAQTAARFTTELPALAGRGPAQPGGGSKRSVCGASR